MHERCTTMPSAIREFRGEIDDIDTVIRIGFT
jgi:hypothetical protein